MGLLLLWGFTLSSEMTDLKHWLTILVIDIDRSVLSLNSIHDCRARDLTDNHIPPKKKIKEWMVALSIVIFLIAMCSVSAVFSSFQITYAQIIQKSIPPEQKSLIGMNSSITLKSNTNQFPIKYHITNGRISGIFIERDNTTLLLNLSSASNGTLVIDLPRNIIDSKGPRNVDQNFTVFVDGQYVGYNEIRTNSHSRTIMLNFDNNPSVIEISGTHTIPEFADTAIVILAVSIAGFVICGCKSKLKI